MADLIKNVLFLCTHNSARSVMAEALLNAHGAGRYRGFSAGSHPSGRINPFVERLLASMQLPTDGMRSKDWDEFAKPGAPAMDFVFTVCDQAAGESCPVWPGRPVTAHWGFPDPSSFEGSDTETAIFTADVFRMIERRIRLFVALPLGQLTRPEAGRRIEEIGKMPISA